MTRIKIGFFVGISLIVIAFSLTVLSSLGAADSSMPTQLSAWASPNPQVLPHGVIRFELFARSSDTDPVHDGGITVQTCKGYKATFKAHTARPLTSNDSVLSGIESFSWVFGTAPNRSAVPIRLPVWLQVTPATPGTTFCVNVQGYGLSGLAVPQQIMWTLK